MLSATLPVIFSLLWLGGTSDQAGPGGLVAHWSFDGGTGAETRESIAGIDDALSGNHRFVPGVAGQALVFDGYTTRVTRPADRVPKLGPDFTIEAWIALGAYPWNWAPIAAQENTVSLNSNKDTVCWPDDIAAESPHDGFYFGIGPQGQLGLHMGAGRWTVSETERAIPLRRWVHVAAVFRQGRGVSLYIDGEKTAEHEVLGPFRQAEGEDLRIGMGRQKLEPSNPVGPTANLACWYSLDGVLDELRIRDAALSDRDIAGEYESSKPGCEPPLPPRVMPSGPKGPGVFGACYARLAYYPEWDALWPVSSDPDIVVQFDDSPIRVVFWRGTRYSPAWVMDGDLWMADQSVENGNDTDGCIEHMLDARCRFSSVRIVENTDARVVIHWRYCPTSANGNHSQLDPVSGWEDWVDEYHTYYPDQVGVRKVILHTVGTSLWPEEVIAFCQPGQRPEDVIDLAAMTLVNLKGHSHTYTWADRTPEIVQGDKYLHFGMEPDEKPVIMRVNLRSENKPFQIFETDNRFRIYTGELGKGISRFPWWNHWPVAMIPSDGRYCQAADRASHFSLAWGGPQPHKGEGKFYWWTWMYGVTKGPAESLVPAARAWLAPPAVTFAGSGATCVYDRAERCFVISGIDPGSLGRLCFRLEAAPGSPLVNPAFVVKGWGKRGVTLRVDGRDVPRGKNFRWGRVRRIDSEDLVIWMALESAKPVTIELAPRAYE